MKVTVFCSWCKNLSIQSKKFWVKYISTVFGNISKDFSVDNIKKAGLYGYVYDFSVIMIVLMMIMFYIFINI